MYPDFSLFTIRATEPGLGVGGYQCIKQECLRATSAAERSTSRSAAYRVYCDTLSRLPTPLLLDLSKK